MEALQKLFTINILETLNTSGDCAVKNQLTYCAHCHDAIDHCVSVKYWTRWTWFLL